MYIPGVGGEADRIKFNQLETFSIQGLYEQILESPCIAKLYPDTPKIQLELNLFEGLMIGTVNILFKEDSKDGNTGTTVTQYFELVTPNFFANFIEAHTKSRYKVFLEHAQTRLQDFATET